MTHQGTPNQESREAGFRLAGLVWLPDEAMPLLRKCGIRFEVGLAGCWVDPLVSAYWHDPRVTWERLPSLLRTVARVPADRMGEANVLVRLGRPLNRVLRDLGVST